MVNQPDFSSAELRLNGAPVTELELRGRRQRLHMDCALAEWEYSVPLGGGAVHVRVEKFLSMANRHTAAMRFTLRAEGAAADCSLSLGWMGPCATCPSRTTDAGEHRVRPHLGRGEGGGHGGRRPASRQHLRELARDGHGLRRALHGRGGALRRAARGICGQPV